MTPYAPYARARRSDITLFGPLVILLAALGFLVATLPGADGSIAGFHVPGARTLASLVDRVPVPWKTVRPESVPLPDIDLSAAPPLPGVAAPAVPDASPAAAATIAQTLSSAATAPVAPPATAAPEAVVDALPANPAVTAPLAASFRLDNFKHQWQTWNNCGPATVTMALSHFGRTETQAQAAPFLKPNANDKNVNPDELVAYVRSIGYRADWMVAGDMDRIKRLVANDVPVIVETWFTPHPNDGMGHYRLLVGWDDASQQVIFYDSYEPPGLNVRVKYAAFDADWRVFSRTYIPVYPPEKADLVDAILGADRDEGQMRQHALDVAQAEVAAQPNDAYAWFNLGAALTHLDRTDDAVGAFDRARSLRLPWRMLWYQFTPFEAYLAQGRLNDVLTLANANLQQANDLEESQYFRGQALQRQGQTGAARAAYQAAVRANPKYGPALYALGQLGG